MVLFEFRYGDHIKRFQIKPQRIVGFQRKNLCEYSFHVLDFIADFLREKVDISGRPCVIPFKQSIQENAAFAEKFEAIVSLAYDNSRFKDYYDIYVLAHRHNFDGAELADALKETFENRHTSMDDIVAFEDGFADDPLRQSRWQSFVKKKKAMLPVTMEETIESIQVFLLPVVESIRAGKDFQKDWDYEKQMWI